MRTSEVESRATFSASSPSSARLAWLIEISRLLTSAVDLDHLLRVILRTSSQLVGSEDSSLLLLDPATHELVFVMVHGTVSEKLKMIRLKPGEGIAGWVVQHGKPLLVNDVEQDPRFTSKVDKVTGFRTKAILAVPLQDHGRTIGVLEVLNPRKDTCRLRSTSGTARSSERAPASARQSSPRGKWQKLPRRFSCWVKLASARKCSPVPSIPGATARPSRLWL